MYVYIYKYINTIASCWIFSETIYQLIIYNITNIKVTNEKLRYFALC